jgi:CRP-like cAMP-binding protein
MRSFNIDQNHRENRITPRPLMTRESNIRDRVEQNGLRTDAIQPAALTVNRILKQLPIALLKKLQPQTRKVSFSGGEYIYRPDEEMDWIYFPETTAISELKILEDGRTIEVSITGRESAVGLPSLFWPGRSANWVQVCTPGTAIKIKRDVLKKETRGSDWVNGLFYGSINSYITQVSQKVACNAHHTVEERFSSWLLMLHDRCSVNRLKLTQEHIARVLGVYRPSVTCIAQEMREVGVIDYVRGNIVILDRDGLMDRSCACYGDLSAMSLDRAPELDVRWA